MFRLHSPDNVMEVFLVSRSREFGPYKTGERHSAPSNARSALEAVAVARVKPAGSFSSHRIFFGGVTVTRMPSGVFSQTDGQMSSQT